VVAGLMPAIGPALAGGILVSILSSAGLGAAAGSVIGGAIGHQFGSGNDRDALTVLGAVAGGAVAHHRAVAREGYATRDVPVQRCEVVHERVTEPVNDGYLVTYRLEGQRYTMRTDRHPGDWVQIAAQPVGLRQVRY